jgi:hypothetical protein
LREFICGDNVFSTVSNSLGSASGAGKTDENRSNATDLTDAKAVQQYS